MQQRNTLILFAKDPQICRVKTRMWPHLSHRESLYLHKHAIERLIEQFSNTTQFNFKLYTTEKYSRYFSKTSIQTKQQYGIDLGARMFNAMREELKTAERVIIIGSDCLSLDVELISKVFAKLSNKNYLVLNPANDGGYVLLGARKISARLFQNIDWGGPTVLHQTQNNALKLGYAIELLPSLIDIDRIEDLFELNNMHALPAWTKRLVNKNL